MRCPPFAKAPSEVNGETIREAAAPLAFLLGGKSAGNSVHSYTLRHTGVLQFFKVASSIQNLCLTLHVTSGKKKERIQQQQNLRLASETSELQPRKSDWLPPERPGRNKKHFTFLHIYTSRAMDAVMKLQRQFFFYLFIFYLSLTGARDTLSWELVPSMHCMWAGLCGG